MNSKRILAIALCLLLLWPVVASAATIKNNFDWVIARRLTVSKLGAIIQLGDLEVTEGNVEVVAGDLAVTAGDTTLGGHLITTAAGEITVTPGGTVTPAGSYQPITAAASGTGTSAIAGCSTDTTGDRVTFINTSANTITFTDTGTLKLSGNAALGQYDVLSVLCDGTNWLQTGKVDN